jgi:hypothetical protein
LLGEGSILLGFGLGLGDETDCLSVNHAHELAVKVFGVDNVQVLLEHFIIVKVARYGGVQLNVLQNQNPT